MICSFSVGWNLTFNRIIWPWMTLNDLETDLFLMIISKASFWRWNDNFQLRSKFYLLRDYLTFSDLEWPRNILIYSEYFKRFILMYNLTFSNQDLNLTFFRIFWPRVTSKISHLKIKFWKFHVANSTLTYHFTTFGLIIFIWKLGVSFRKRYSYVILTVKVIMNSLWIYKADEI